MGRNRTPRLSLRCACGQRLDVLEPLPLGRDGWRFLARGQFAHALARVEEAQEAARRIHGRRVIDEDAIRNAPRARHQDYDRVGMLKEGSPDRGFSYRCGKCGATPSWRTPTVYAAVERALERGARAIIVGVDLPA